MCAGFARPNSRAEARIASLLKNPENPGTPDIARVAIKNVQKVIGIFFLSPPILNMSFVCTAWITLPAPRKSKALKKA